MSHDALGDEPKPNDELKSSERGVVTDSPEEPAVSTLSTDAMVSTLSAVVPLSADATLSAVVPRPVLSWKPSYVFLIAVTVVNLVLDIGSKQWIKRYFDASHAARAMRKIEVIPKYVNLIFATNKGGAWGILQGEQESLRRPFFLAVSVAAIVFILSLYRKLTPEQRALRWGLPLVLGGALGNLVDRIVYGWVIDFIDCYAVIGADEKHWPTFNVADIAICIGVGLMAIDMFTTRESKAAVVVSDSAAPVTTRVVPEHLDAAGAPSPTNFDN